MKRPTKEQIEEMKEGLPDPRNWMGDFYKVIWQDPEDLKPITARRELEQAESYTVELLFKRVVNSCGCCMSWELDESFKGFYEFMAEEPNTHKQPVDEYGIIGILKKHNAESALNEITAVFDRFCESYMGSREEIRKGAFTEVNCYLMTALIEGEGDPNIIESKITELVDAYNNLYTGKTHANKTK
ncbi:MAG: hypothetical protein ACI8ZA_001607 [Gammaproteobacteria bacterium]|jgi:hypothetical protein